MNVNFPHAVNPATSLAPARAAAPEDMLANLLSTSQGVPHLMAQVAGLSAAEKDRLRGDAEELLAGRRTDPSAPPFDRKAASLVLLGRLIGGLQSNGANDSSAVTFANALFNMNELADLRSGKDSNFQTASYLVDHRFVGENANLGAMSILAQHAREARAERGQGHGNTAAILKVALDEGDRHVLHAYGKTQPIQKNNESLHALSERLMLGMLVAHDTDSTSAQQHRSVSKHYEDRLTNDRKDAIHSGLDTLREARLDRLYGIMIRNQPAADRKAANTTPVQFRAIVDAIATQMGQDRGRSGLVFFGDRLPDALREIVNERLPRTQSFHLTEPWRANWGSGKGVPLDLMEQAVLYSTLQRADGLVAVVGNKSGAMDLAANVGVPTIQIGPHDPHADPLANRIGLLSLVSDSWHFVGESTQALRPKGGRQEAGLSPAARAELAVGLSRARARQSQDP